MKTIFLFFAFIAYHPLCAGWLFFDLRNLGAIKPNSYNVDTKTGAVSAEYELSPKERAARLLWNKRAAQGCIATGVVGNVAVLTTLLKEGITPDNIVLSLAGFSPSLAFIEIGREQLRQIKKAQHFGTADTHKIVGTLKNTKK